MKSSTARSCTLLVGISYFPSRLDFLFHLRSVPSRPAVRRPDSTRPRTPLLPVLSEERSSLSPAGPRLPRWSPPDPLCQAPARSSRFHHRSKGSRCCCPSRLTYQIFISLQASRKIDRRNGNIGATIFSYGGNPSSDI